MKGQPKSMWGLRASSAVLAAGGALALCLAAATPASATIPEGTATITNPATNQPLNSGASTVQFTVDLPAQAACAGDTASNGYHVYSYLVPKGTIITSLTFNGAPSSG